MDGFTRIPNWFLDGLHTFTHPERDVLLVVFRQTIGWNREECPISTIEFMQAAGLARQSVISALSALVERGFLVRQLYKQGRYVYRPVYSLDRLTDETGLLTRPVDDEPVYSLDRSSDKTGLVSRPEPVYSLDHDKEERKERKRAAHKETTRRASHAHPADDQQPTQPAPEPTPPQVPPAPPAPTVADQSRLPGTPDAVNPVEIYREVCEVRKPNQEQRAAIEAIVLQRFDLWREVCSQFRRNGWNVRKIDNLTDAYTKALTTVSRQEAAERKAAEHQRVQSERPSLTNQDREKLSAILREARALRSETNGATNTV